MAGLCLGCFAEPISSDRCMRCGFDPKQFENHIRLPLGYVLQNQYVLGRILGRPGGFGITYLAWDNRLQTVLAVKEFYPTILVTRGTDGISVLPDSPENKEVFYEGLSGFLHEARTLARFDHPNIVRVRQYVEDNGTGYLVMDYYEGAPLDAWIKSNGPCEQYEAIRILLPILDGLIQVHERGVLHRDIKPDNVYITRDKRPILLDFGAARAAVGRRSHDMSVVLTPGFAPVEQYSAVGNQGAWTDVYACGATLYYLITGKLAPDAMERVREDTFSFENEDRERIPEPLQVIISKAMAVQIENRYSNVQEMVDELRVYSKDEFEADSEKVSLDVPAERTISCPACDAENVIPQWLELTAARCGKCDSLLIPRNFELVRCGHCDTQNRIPTGAEFESARCGNCKRILDTTSLLLSSA